MCFEMADHSMLISPAASFEKLKVKLALCISVEGVNHTFFALVVE